MAKAYSRYKVDELKEMLRERGIVSNKTKSELIALLEKDDASKESEEAPAAEEAAAPAEPAEPESAAEPVAAEPEPAAPAAAEPPAESAEAVTEEAPAAAGEDHTVSVQFSDEELLQNITTDLEKQIKRAERFGTDPKPLQDRLSRIKRFGISAVRDAAVKAHSPFERKRFRKPNNKKPKRQA